MQNFDVIIIGSGSGTTVAKRCADAGKKVAIIDYHPFGGTCPLRGCMPKKTLVNLAHTLAMNERLKGKGIDTPATASWKDLIQFKNKITEPKSSEFTDKLKGAGVTIYHGRAEIIDKNSIRVNDDILSAEKFVFANGSSPIKLNIPGEDLLIDSTGFMEMEELPDDILFVGGGYIAFEFAHIISQFGVKATIVHMEERVLNNFDADMVELLVKASEKLGIIVILNTEVKSISKENNGFTIHAEQKGEKLKLTTSIAVHAAGRSAEIKDLGLEKMNVSFSKKGIEVNDFMQSVSNENVYSCGDANDKGLPLTPVNSKEATVLIENLLNGNHQKMEYGHIPSTVYTIPPLSLVGLTEQEAKNKNLNFKVHFKETTDWLSSEMINEPVSAFKILVDKDSDQIIGAHLLGSNADEVINIFAVAMNAGIKATELKKTIFSYPTLASDIVNML